MALAVVRSPEEWFARFGHPCRHTAVTIGNFDGVHLGHQQILRTVLARARQSDTLAAVLTFYPHPARVLRPAEAPALLETLEQRLAAIDATGVDAAFVARFDAEFANVAAEDFVRRFLLDTMGAQTVLVGGNFRFGHRGAGDIKLLGEFGQRWGFDVEIVPPVIENGVVVSSTAIRTAIREGRVEEARRMLGRPYALEGEIRTGTGQGRRLVVPTLNLATDQEVLPKNGVYATEAVVAGKTYPAATNVGMRPTFDGARVTIESFLFDFSDTLTSGKLEVRFWQRLREERKFSGPAELREQVLKDIEHAKEFFRSSKLRV
ncbi:MAG TPA: bifunctional riboflavin kinase/FAD synthetase [Candidatus Acidoferrales bacterium]|jgi:riboflavin kinase / FMN adenylyltransferase|nr:bifunctional riboflavin kinase/FAD synthetase [Candidatus Acidoferrales bacterium]